MTEASSTGEAGERAQASSIIQSEHNGHFLSFHEGKHRYTLDGRSVPGVTTFTKGGYPMSEGLLSWMLTRAADAAVRLGFEEAKKNVGVIMDDRSFGVEPLTETRIKELVKEAKKKPDEVADAAADIGTLVHDYAYKTEMGDLNGATALLVSNANHPDIEKVMKCLAKFDSWYAKNQDVVVASEAIVAFPCPLHWTKEDEILHGYSGSGCAQPDEEGRYEGCCLCYGGKFDRLVERNGLLILSDFKTASGIYAEFYVQLAAYKKAIEYWLGRKVDGLEILRFGKETGEFEELLVDDPAEMAIFEDQAMRSRTTFQFKKEWSADRRFSYIPQKKK